MDPEGFEPVRKSGIFLEDIKSSFFVVSLTDPEGFEPSTTRLEAECSVQAELRALELVLDKSHVKGEFQNYYCSGETYHHLRVDVYPCVGVEVLYQTSLRRRHLCALFFSHVKERS